MQAVTQVRMHVQKRILKASDFPSLSLAALQEWAKEWAPGWVNFTPAVAYHFCLNLAVQFSKPGAHFLVQPCTIQTKNVARGAQGVFRKNARILRDSFPFCTCAVGGGRRGAKGRSRQKRHRSHLICFNAPEMTLRRRSVGRTFAFLRLPVRPSPEID